jgi:hypothetical protein
MFIVELWTPLKYTKDIAVATKRLSFSRCHILSRRGIKAGPIQPDYCEADYNEE